MELGSRNLNKTMKVSDTFTDICIPSQIFVYLQIIKNICESEQISVKIPSRRLNKNQINVGKSLYKGGDTSVGKKPRFWVLLESKL